jgi:hypothetical protein
MIGRDEHAVLRTQERHRQLLTRHGWQGRIMLHLFLVPD